MFYHVKELQYDARVSRPDPRFASLLLEQFGGGNGELKAAMQYFVQAFAARQPYPDKYDMLMDIAAEEFSHLEIVGATITMLTGETNAELKNAVEQSDLMRLLGRNGNQERDGLIQQAFLNPQFFVLSGGGPRVTDSQGVPWQGSFVNANGDLTVDLRSDIAAESRAKIVYEYLLQFTDDPSVRDTLMFLMTREISHFQMFAAALATIEPNFPPGVLQGDPRFTHKYYNTSNGSSSRGPWNRGQGPWPEGESWTYIEDPIQQVMLTRGQAQARIDGTERTREEAQRLSQQLSERRSQEVGRAIPDGANRWSSYSGEGASTGRPDAGQPRPGEGGPPPR